MRSPLPPFLRKEPVCLARLLGCPFERFVFSQVRFLNAFVGHALTVAKPLLAVDRYGRIQQQFSALESTKVPLAYHRSLSASSSQSAFPVFTPAKTSTLLTMAKPVAVLLLTVSCSNSNIDDAFIC